MTNFTDINKLAKSIRENDLNYLVCVYHATGRSSHTFASKRAAREFKREVKLIYNLESGVVLEWNGSFFQESI